MRTVERGKEAPWTLTMIRVCLGVCRLLSSRVLVSQRTYPGQSSRNCHGDEQRVKCAVFPALCYSGSCCPLWASNVHSHHHHHPFSLHIQKAEDESKTWGFRLPGCQGWYPHFFCNTEFSIILANLQFCLFHFEQTLLRVSLPWVLSAMATSAPHLVPL